MNKIEALPQTQYVRTIRPLEFEDWRGRTTSIIEGVPGFIVGEHNLSDFCDNEKELKRCRDLLEIAAERGGDSYFCVLMLQGYPCLVPPECFIKCDKPKIYPVPFEVI